MSLYKTVIDKDEAAAICDRAVFHLENSIKDYRLAKDEGRAESWAKWLQKIAYERIMFSHSMGLIADDIAREMMRDIDEIWYKDSENY